MAGARHAAGPAAIEAYLDDPLDSRLIMSMKCYLAQRSFTETRILGRAWTLEALVALSCAHWLGAARAADGRRAHRGRPPRALRGRDAPTTRCGEAPAARRLRRRPGLPDVRLALEPAARRASLRAGARSRRPPCWWRISAAAPRDFSVLRFDPGPPRRVAALGHAGVGIAGDAFDYRIIDHVVSPRLGKGSNYRVMGRTRCRCRPPGMPASRAGTSCR